MTMDAFDVRCPFCQCVQKTSGAAFLVHQDSFGIYCAGSGRKVAELDYAGRAVLEPKR